jgi:hypothetical protein
MGLILLGFAGAGGENRTHDLPLTNGLRFGRAGWTSANRVPARDGVSVKLADYAIGLSTVAAALSGLVQFKFFSKKPLVGVVVC